MVVHDGRNEHPENIQSEDEYVNSPLRLFAFLKILDYIGNELDFSILFSWDITMLAHHGQEQFLA